jgi:beta-propeller repeat-containing protein
MPEEGLDLGPKILIGAAMRNFLLVAFLLLDGIAVDASGSAYATGSTLSTDFPLMNPLQAEYGGAFVAKLDPAGKALVYSTYLGHDMNDRGHSIAVDATGSAYVTGQTAPILTGVALAGRGAVSPPNTPEMKTQPAVPNFLLVNPVQSTYGGGQSDGFVAKINPAGTALVYSTYLGGNDSDGGNGIAVDATGNAYVVGHSFSMLFPKNNSLPVRHDGCRTVERSQANGFVIKLNPASDAFVYTACLADSLGMGIAVDGAGNAYVTGYTEAKDLPTVNPLQTAHRGGQFDVFVAKVNPAGSALDFATYLGGGSNDYGFGIAVDPSGNIYLTGNTDSENFPLVNPLQKMNRGTGDTFVVKISLK